MKQILLFIIVIILGFSCKEDIYYGTSISILNELNDTLSVILYPKIEPFHSMKELEITPSFKQIIYGRKKTDINILALMKEVFDSIVIIKDGLKIKLSPDTTLNSNFNPYIDIGVWDSEIVEGDCPTSFSNTHTITEDYYFRIGELEISK